MDGTLGGEPSVFGSDSNRIPPRERMAKRPNGRSCLIRFETKFKLGRASGRKSRLSNPLPRFDQRRNSLQEPLRRGDIVIQNFKTASFAAHTGAGATGLLR